MAVWALLDVVSAGIGTLIYASACLRASFKSNLSSKWDWSAKKLARKKPKVVPRTALSWLHVFGNTALFGLSFSHAITTALDKSTRGLISNGTSADFDVSCVLFGSLVWLVFLLGMTDVPLGSGYEQLVPWMVACVLYAVSAALSSSRLAQSKYAATDRNLQWVRIAILLVLIASIPIQKYVDRKTDDSKIDEETRPLLESADPVKSTQDEDEVAYDPDDDKSVKSTLSMETDNGENDEEEDESKKLENEQRRALRDRPWFEYIASFRIFLPFIRPRSFKHHVYLTITILNTLAARAVTLGQPLIYGSVIRDLTLHTVSYPKILAFVGLRFLSSPSGINLIRSVVTYRLNTEMHNALTRFCFAHVMSLSADFHNGKSTPSTWQIMDRGNSVVELLQDILFRFLPVIADLFIALVVVTKLFGAYLCFVVATTMILLSWTNRVTMASKNDMRRNFIDIYRNYYSHMSECFSHWRTVSEFNKVGHEIIRHGKKTDNVTRTQIKQRSFRLWLEAIQEVVVTLGFLLVVIIAGREIAAGRADVGRFVTLIAYWSQIMNPVTTLAGSASNISEQLVDAEKLMLLLERKPSIVSKPNAPNFVFKGGKIEFRDVSFSYDGSRDVTSSVSFVAQPGETIALVGETGGGKSTIFNLLYRFFDPKSGSILVDDQDLKDVNLESYRAHLGLVPQNPVLFNQSIMKNIKYSNLDATTAEVVEASRIAQFHEKVQKFPKKYYQKVGEMAQKLSGGELQRLAIARAILKKPNILLLDEATSAVDSVTETKIQDALDHLTAGRTTFVIAHRLSTIINANKILVVKAGEIVEAGTHEQLVLKDGGAYRELWDAQQKLSGGQRKKNAKKDADDVVLFDDTQMWKGVEHAGSSGSSTHVDDQEEDKKAGSAESSVDSWGATAVISETGTKSTSENESAGGSSATRNTSTQADQSGKRT